MKCVGHDLDFLDNPDFDMCPFNWHNNHLRKEFYTECLENYDVLTLRERAKSAARDLQILAFEIKRATENKGWRQVGGGTALIVGGLLGGLGLGKDAV